MSAPEAPVPGAPMVVTFGCRLNAFEAEVMRGFGAASPEAPATIIVNTCAVTAEAERQGRQAIRRLRRKYPDARIVVTGCAAQVNPHGFEGMPEVDQVLGNADKLDPQHFHQPAPERMVVTDIMRVRETAGHLISGFEGRSRAFIEVQQGCDHRCTFCIIPFGRGPSRSVPVSTVIDQIKHLVDQGFAEVVLTGVDVTSYGGDLPDTPALGSLVKTILADVPELPRLRLSSLDPVEIDDHLLDALASHDRLMPHLHLSVQAGDDTILKRMKRRHLRDDVVRVAQRLRDLRPGIALGADLIAGFPTETDEMFERGLALVDEAGLTHLHVFPYSARPGTPAARMRRVPGDVVAARAQALRAAGDAAMARLMTQWVGRDVEVLAEADGEGFTAHYLPTRLSAPVVPGRIARARTTGIDGQKLLAEVLA